jgi:hypothetical protein
VVVVVAVDTVLRLPYYKAPLALWALKLTLWEEAANVEE